MTPEEAASALEEAKANTKPPGTKGNPNCDGEWHSWWDGPKPFAAKCNCKNRVEVSHDVQAERLLWDRFPEPKQFGALGQFPVDSHNREAFQAVTDAVNEGGRKGIFLHGPVGTGKTTLAVLAVQAGIKAHRKCDAMGCQDFVWLLSEAAGHGDGAEVAQRRLAEVAKTKVFLLDDISWAQRTAEAGKQSVLTTFENGMMDLLDVHQGVLLVTGNFGTQDKDGVYDLEKAVGKRVWSRMVGRLKSFRVSGPDRRRRP